MSRRHLLSPKQRVTPHCSRGYGGDTPGSWDGREVLPALTSTPGMLRQSAELPARGLDPHGRAEQGKEDKAAAAKTIPDVPFEQKAPGGGAGTGVPWRGDSQSSGWCWVMAQRHGVTATQPHPQPREAVDAMARGERDGDKDLLRHPELSWQTPPIIAWGSDIGTGDGAELGSALGSKK